MRSRPPVLCAGFACFRVCLQGCARRLGKAKRGVLIARRVNYSAYGCAEDGANMPVTPNLAFCRPANPAQRVRCQTRGL
jgi:hypothetical protein